MMSNCNKQSTFTVTDKEIRDSGCNMNEPMR